MQSLMKTCFKCGVEKPLEDFYKHPAMADGRVGKCKECNKADVRANRAAKLAYYRAYDVEREKTTKRRKRRDDFSKKWCIEFPERAKAHKLVYAAVKKGDLIKQPCERCGRKDTHAHHEDYSKPLDVMWLCPVCHKARHKEIDAEKAENNSQAA